jgi:hypothetical protein
VVDHDFVLWIVVGTALAFDFTNGFHDTANAVATSISTRALSPRIAVTMAAVLNFVGAFISLAVAATIAKGIVNADLITPAIVFAGLIGAIAWNLLTWYWGLPSSSSHALIGGVVGSAFNAAMDAIAEHGINEVIVSTLPAQSSGWMKRDLIEALQAATGLKITHVVVDLAREGLPFDVTLVVANQTVAGSELVDRLKELAAEGPHRFIIVVPQDDGDGRAVKAARERLGTLLSSLEEAQIVAAGMIGDPDPFVATMNAVQFFHISDIVISTLPEGSSKWVADKLVERVQKATNVPVDHIETSPEPVEAGA